MNLTKELPASRIGLSLLMVFIAIGVTGCWEIQDVGDLPGGPSFSEAYGLNENGEVVGYGTTGTTNEAFVWSSAAGMRGLPRQGASSCVAYAINNAGQVVGACLQSISGKHLGVAWVGNQQIPINFGGRTILSSEVFAVNQNGEVAGSFREITGNHVFDIAFTWKPGVASGVRGLDALPADVGGSGAGRAINAQGWIAGNALLRMHVPYLWNPVNGRPSPVGQTSGAALPSGEARGINDARQVVGVYDGKGFLWTPGSPHQTVGTTETIPLEPYDINNKGQIVGVSNGRAVLYDSITKQLTDLGGLSNVTSAGWRSLSLARAINDKGQIAGYGVNSAGEVHGFLLSPL